MKWLIIRMVMFFLLSGYQNISHSAHFSDFLSRLPEPAQQAFPVATGVSAPEGLRPCCVFGYGAQVKLGKIPLPFFTIDNVLEPDALGEHIYNNSFMSGIAAVMGLSHEHTGIIYTRRGGFIDLAHVRDTADYTFWLFTQIYPRLGEARMLTLSSELFSRRIQLYAFTPPQSQAEKYTLSVYLAARLAFRLAVWHEIAQWYGYQSVPGIPEEISAFTPEDLYSNLLGARLAISLLSRGYGDSVSHFSSGMQGVIPEALKLLKVQPAEITRHMLDNLNGSWWNKQERIPDKFFVLCRNYDVNDVRLPFQPPEEMERGVRLMLPQSYSGRKLASLASIELWPTKEAGTLPVTRVPFTEKDFPVLIKYAADTDMKLLKRQMCPSE
ncbi:DUF4056 domain-containing protein [Escherichia coli]|uniref:DUF4056 domain-containing protein n=1 Tax=Escherichia coli TaxID=562 RepID=UPI0019D1E700|nr:DUF4056 domain-containing protein [Escherichia coli]MBN6397312.1 DUF4056 domain-containing protein [Escherichia coli]MEB7099178.1 DUF4056 domain-containing protein [Escherichia coli]